jgi:arginase
MSPRAIDVLGVPFNSSGTTDGVARGPEALRAAGLIGALRAAGVDVRDRGDLALGPTSPVRDPASHVIAPAARAAMIRLVRVKVDASLDDGRSCGHGARFALGLTIDGLPDDLVTELPRVEPQGVVVIGARDASELAEAGVESIGGLVEIMPAEAVDTGEAARIGAAAIERLARAGPPWYHVDLDVLSTASLGSVDNPQLGGLDWVTLTTLSIGALSGGAVAGWDVTIYNPDLDRNRGDARRIVGYLVDVLRG